MSQLTKRTGLIGYPLGHSLSPIIHSHWIEKYGLDAKYEAIEIAPGNLPQVVPLMISKGFKGFNVTLPYKQDIMAHCNDIEDSARKIGAVNTISVRGDGLVTGMNTDVFGFIENLKLSGTSFVKGTALVIGAGGAARAIIYGLQQMGFRKIFVTNRTAENAAAVARDFGIETIDWDQRDDGKVKFDFVVNTTSLGMEGQPALKFDVKHLPRHAVVCDIVYNPLYTSLLNDARNRGLQTVTGLGMLLHQARMAFQKWFGVMPEIDKSLQQKIERGGGA